MRTLKDIAKRLLRLRGYEVYRRPHLPKGADVYESLRSHWPAWQPRVIFDVGANVGQTIARLRPLFPLAEIHAFEPIPTTFAVLQSSTKGTPHLSLHCLALGDRSGTVSMHSQAASDLSSLAPALLASSDTESMMEAVQLQTAADFCNDAGIKHVDLLKIDVEGFELEVLAGAKPLLTADAVDFIVAEAGLMPGNPRFTPLPRLIDVLQPYGFWLIGLYEQYGSRYSQTAEFCNALFAHERHL